MKLSNPLVFEERRANVKAIKSDATITSISFKKVFNRIKYVVQLSKISFKERRTSLIDGNTKELLIIKLLINQIINMANIPNSKRML
jgi:hypothetical protein